MESTCDRNFVTEKKAEECNSIADIITSDEAASVAKLLEQTNNSGNNDLEKNEKATIDTIVCIIKKFNTSSRGLITKEDKNYLLSFLDETITQENLKKVLSRYLSTVKDKETFLAKMFFDNSKQIDIEKFIKEFKEYIENYKMKEFKFEDYNSSSSGIYNEINGKGLFVKTETGFEKISEDAYYSINEIYYDRFSFGNEEIPYITRDSELNKGIFIYNAKTNTISNKIDPEYRYIHISNGFIFTTKDGKKGLKNYNSSTKQIETLLDEKYDDIKVDKGFTVTLDGKKGYFEYKDGKLIETLELSGTLKVFLYNLGIKF